MNNEPKPTPKQYSQEVRDALARAKAWVAAKRAEGWTRADFAAGLKKMLESPTGDPE